MKKKSPAIEMNDDIAITNVVFIIWYFFFAKRHGRRELDAIFSPLFVSRYNLLDDGLTRDKKRGTTT